nr:arylacetamide deacetylase-like 4 [Pogona vitticeps]
MALNSSLLKQSKLLEKLSICQRYKIWRIVLKGMPPRRTSKLMVKDLLFDDVPVRVYWPKTKSDGSRRGLVYFYGGAYMLGSIQAYERTCRYLARKSDTVIVCVRYRQAPEHPFPAQYQDCIAATAHFLKNAKEYGVDPNRVSVAGDSSGGAITSAVCQILVTRKDLPRLRSQLLFYPFLQGVDLCLPSYQQNRSVPVMSKKNAVELGLRYLNEKIKDVSGVMRNAHVPEELRVRYKKWISAENIPEEFKVRDYVAVAPAPFSEKLYTMCKLVFDPMISPLLGEDDVIRQLPEAFIFTCEYDVLRDDGLLYKKRLEDNGVPVTWVHDETGFHGILFPIDRYMFEFQKTRSDFQHAIRFLERL